LLLASSSATGPPSPSALALASARPSWGELLWNFAPRRLLSRRRERPLSHRWSEA
jgi:hypothetical protein